MKLLKNRVFVTVVAVALLLSVVMTVLSLSGHIAFMGSAANFVTTPFRAAFGWIGDGVKGVFDRFARVDELLKENEALKEQLETYRKGAERAELLEGENDWLREQMELTEKYSNIKFSDARITGMSSNSYSDSVMLNRGSESGIKEGMAVVATTGVVGYIKEVGLGCSKAVLITDPTAAVGVYTKDGYFGTVTGSIGARASGLCVLERMSVGGLEGQTLYTTGYGGMFPPDLPVGVIESSTVDPYNQTYTYTVRPAVDFSTLRGVMIVTEVTPEVQDG